MSKLISAAILVLVFICAAQAENIVFAGDSITAGVACAGPQNKEERYSTVLTKMLQKNRPELKEINLGRSGVPLCRASNAGQLSEQVLAQKPDIVVMQYGANDCYWGYSTGQFAVAYDTFIHDLRKAKPDMPILLMTLPAHFGWTDNPDQWICAANVVIQEIAAKYNCHLADIHEALNHNKKLYADFIHPDKAGHLKIAATAAAALAMPPLSKNNLRLAFDCGNEIRFAGYVFLPEWVSIEHSWVKASKLSPDGMTLDTRVPVTIHIMTYEKPNISRTLSINDKNGKEIVSEKVSTGGKRAIRFRFDPKNNPGPFEVSLKTQN